MVDAVTKIVALFAVGTYALGLLTVNLYLYRLGASDFSLIRGRYISIGFLACCFILGSGLLPVYFLLNDYHILTRFPIHEWLTNNTLPEQVAAYVGAFFLSWIVLIMF